MSDKEPFTERVKHMSVDDLLTYETAAVFVGRLINVVGVLTLWFMLCFPYIGIIIVGTILVWAFSQISIGANEILISVREHLEKKR
jgi:hypothetical protein